MSRCCQYNVYEVQEELADCPQLYQRRVLQPPSKDTDLSGRNKRLKWNMDVD